MDAKDLRTETALGERSSDGTSKYTHMGTTLPCSVNKSYPEISSNPLAKVDTPTSRPCAVIGPDRVLPPSTNTDVYLKKNHYEPWLSTETTFRYPPEYPHKTNQSPIRNISPRQTFQENMQRIMVAPTYNSMKFNEDANFVVERNATLGKVNKLSGSADSKYCDVPYSINNVSDTQKNTEMCVSNMNNARNCPPIWHPSGVSIRPTRPYGAPELYQFPDYASCAGPRSIAVTRPPHRTINEDSSHLYTEAYYHHGNVRFKPYPTVKERYPQARYEYVNNYPNPFHPPPPFPPHKYDLHKPSHPSYPQIPIKYFENRISDSVVDGYQRPNQQVNYNNAPYQNQMLHPAYAPVLPNSLQGKLYSYPQDKTVAANKLPFESNKVYLDYDNSRNKGYPENLYINDISRSHMKSQVIIPNYQTMNIPPIQGHPYYRKEGHLAKGYDHIPHFRNVDPSVNTNHLTRMTSQFSPNGIAISPSDSNTSNDTAHTQSNSLEDCGYVSQSSTASVRSIDSGIHRMIPNDIHRRYSYGYPSLVRATPFPTKMQSNVNHNINPKEKKGIDVRQFLQMWNEGDDENTGNPKETQIEFNHDSSKCLNQYEGKTQEQLYVLGLVNVPSEELGKYEHIQKVSKLPDNIKGYNNIELLKHFEEAIEFSNLNNICKTSTPRNFHPTRNSISAGVAIPARPISPLDVEAKISQSVIHKEVGCNFEIRPCSPEMLNVEVATPVQNILDERVIEKVSNPYQSPVLSNIADNEKKFNLSKQDNVVMLNETVKIPSCKLINNNQCSNSDVLNVIRADYSLQDLESNSGVCLASLPRLDNDIELNFPEVNQQFINANKESVITSKDLQRTSDVDNCISEKDELSNSDNNSNLPSKEIEKEFSKLSKYRKNKKSETKDQQSFTNSQFIRTDSVIIKNPENIKYFEDATECPIDATITEKEQDDVLNLSPTIMLHTNIVKMNNKEPDNDNNMAIDFSLNKSRSNSDIEEKTLDANENSCKSPYTDNTPLDKVVLQPDNTIELDSCDTTLINKNTHSTKDEDANPSEIQNYSESTTFTKETMSEIIVDKDFKQDLNINNTKEMTKNEALESVLSISLSSFNKNIESDKIVENVNETLTDKNGLSSFNEGDNNESSSNCNKIRINEDTASNSYVSLIKLDCDDYNTNVESNKDCADSIDFVEPKIKNTTNEVNIVSPQWATSEQREDSVQLNIPSNGQFIQSISVITDEPCQTNTDNFAYQSTILTCDKTSSIGTTRCKTKSCNLKKNLFSPWIQKLILQSDFIMPKIDNLNKSLSEIVTICEEKGIDSAQTPLLCGKECYFSTNIELPSISDKPSENICNDKLCTIEDKKENFLKQTEINQSLDISIKIHEKPHNVGDNHEDTYAPIIQSFEQNDADQLANVTLDTCSNAHMKDNSEQTKAFQLTNTFTECTNMPNKTCEIEVKSDIEYLKEHCDAIQSPNILMEKSSECCADKDQRSIACNTPDLGLKDLDKQSGANKSPDISKNTSSEVCSDQHNNLEPRLVEQSSVQSSNVLIEELKPEYSKSEEKNKIECYTKQNIVTQIKNIETQSSKDIVDKNYKDLNKKETECFSNIIKPIKSPTLRDTSNLSSCYENEDDPKVTIMEELEITNSPNIPIDEAKHVVSKDLLQDAVNIINFTVQSNEIDELKLLNLPKTPNEEGNKEEIQDSNTLIATDGQSTPTVLENVKLVSNLCDDIKPDCENYTQKRRRTLKRSLSDSALDIINTNLSDEFGSRSMWYKKRRKNNEFLNICDPHFISENLCDIQHNRRNSISSVYNEDNLSFCIVIEDDCIITQENEEKICFAEVSEDGLSEAQENHFTEEDIAAPSEMLLCSQTDPCEVSEPFVLEISDENTLDKSWLDDIGCVETVVSDDVAEDVTISAPSSPQDEDIFEHTDKVKYIYGDKMCNDDAELVETLYRTPQMNVNKTLSNRESHVTGDFEEFGENSSLKIGSASYNTYSIKTELNDILASTCPSYTQNFVKEAILDNDQKCLDTCEDNIGVGIDKNTADTLITQDDTVNSCESSVDNVFLYSQGNDSFSIETPSSPEVSSTTSEEKGSSILLKITNYKGMRTSQINESNAENNSSNCCKFTEKMSYTSYKNSSKPRPLITKGAQKYIPPLTEPLDDLKVKLPLPQQSLLKLKQLKLAKAMPKQSISQNKDICKKPKPRFEDVLKSIDEIQFKMHKEKLKRPKKSVPKVVIKKSENGSHYASMPNKACFNPDLTGRKWQPWVFIEKDTFIDKMAIRRKTKAIFNYRKNTFVLADKFRKYKSASSGKFIISQPKFDDSSTGHLKYTIKLKHTY